MSWYVASTVGNDNCIVYNTPGTYTLTIPSGSTTILFEMIGAGGKTLFGGVGGTGGYIKGTINVTSFQGQTITIFVGAAGTLSPYDPSTNPAGASYIYIPTTGPLFVMAGAGGGGSSAAGTQYGGWGGGGSFTSIGGSDNVAIGGNGQTNSSDPGSFGGQGGQTGGGGAAGSCGGIPGTPGSGRPIPENYLEASGGGAGTLDQNGGSGYTGGGSGCGAGGGSSYYNSAYTAINLSYPGNTVPAGTLQSSYGRANNGGYVSVCLS